MPPGHHPTMNPSQKMANGPLDLGATHSARSILESARYFELDRRQSYYECTQHDLKQYDFDGRMVAANGGFSATQPLLNAAQAPMYVPLRQRRPSSPYRLARSITNSFTMLVFGEGRFPTITVADDPESQEFVRGLVKACNLSAKMVRARTLGGACGSVGISWCFVDGAPKVEVHNAKHLWVHEWADREQLIPAHVTEVFLFEEDDYDASKGTYGRKWFWFRRDWTLQADIVYKKVEFERRGEPRWEVDPERSVIHNEGECHFVWIQNTANEQVDGTPDYDGHYEMLDSLDMLFSTIVRGTTLNLDPTLVLRMDPELVARQGVRKGSDNALIVGETGSAQYMEMSGAGINAGLEVLREKRRYTLEAVQCVIPDPNEVAAHGTSSVALKLLYAPMLARCDQFREQYGAAIERLLTCMLRAAQRIMAAMTIRTVDAFGVEAEEVPKWRLPPRVETRPAVDQFGEPSGELETVRVPQSPGLGAAISLAWGPYFAPTEQDKQTAAGFALQANGGKPVMSQQSAVESFAALTGRDGTDEWNRLQQESARESQQQGAMFGPDPGVGGAVGAPGELPPGALEAPPPDGGLAPPELPLAAPPDPFGGMA